MARVAVAVAVRGAINGKGFEISPQKRGATHGDELGRNPRGHHKPSSTNTRKGVSS